MVCFVFSKQCCDKKEIWPEGWVVLQIQKKSFVSFAGFVVNQDGFSKLFVVDDTISKWIFDNATMRANDSVT